GGVGGWDRGGDEGGRVVGDFPGDVVGKRFRTVVHQFFERFDRGQRVGARRLVDTDEARRRAIQTRRAIKIRRAELYSRDRTESQDRTVRIGADDNVFEFRTGPDPPL